MKTEPSLEKSSGAAADGGASAQAVLEVVGALLAEVGDGRGLALLTLDSSLERDLGLGSLERVELMCRLEAAFDVRLPEEALATAETARDILKHVRSRRILPPGGAEAEAARNTREPPRPANDAPAPPAAPPPERARTLLEVLEYRAARDPARVHVTLVKEDGTEEPITFADLRRDAGAVAAALRGLGLGPHARVAIMLPTSRGYFAAFLGAMLAGGVPVPIYPPFRLDRITEYVARQARILTSAGAEVLITFDRAARVGDFARDAAPSLRQVVSIETLLATRAGSPVGAALGPDDTALLQYTSGSTGDPKGVELTHASVLANIRAAAAGVEMNADDIMVSWLPLYHDMGLIGGWLLNLYLASRTVILSPLTFLARPETWLEAATRHRATRSVAPNFAFELCARRVKDDALARLDLSAMRTVLNGSEPVHPETLERFAARFAPVGFRREALFPAYGLAENMVAVCFPPLDRGPLVDAIERAPFESEGRASPAASGSADALRFVSVGRAVPGHEVRIADAAGEALPERRQGRLLFRGPSSFKGYFGDPEATARVKLADGWVDSGDLAYQAEGEVFITGRVKDIIIKGGKNYYPHEIEAAASSVADVRQGCVAAFGVSDEMRGTEAIVVVAETRAVDASRREAIAREVGAAVAAAVGVPADHVVLVSPGAVPKTSSGKLRRAEARRLYLAGELERRQASFGRQAAGLFLRGVPGRAAAAAARVVEVAYGVYAGAVFLPLFGLAAVLAVLTPGGRPMRRLSTLHARAALGLAGLRPRARGVGRLPRGAAVLVVNHASYLDPYLLVATLPDDVRYVIKGECRDVPVLGRVAARAGHVLIDRHAPERSLEGLRELGALLAAGEKVVVFAEGRFLREAGLRPFKLGAFRLACECGVPVVPIAIRGTRRAFRDGMWIPRRVPLGVEILDPIAPGGRGIADMIHLRDRAADAIAAHIDEPRLERVSVGEAF